MKHITLNDIEQMEKVYRLNLINAISGFKSANLIGTVDEQGIENCAIFSSVIHLGSNPPYLGFVTRPATVPRHTLENIRERKYYTINHIGGEMIEAAHHSSAKYPQEVSEFEKTGLSPQYLNEFIAPYVQNSPVKIGLQLMEEIPIKTNDTIMVVGKVLHLYIDENCIGQDGHADIEQAGTVAISGLDSYHGTTRLNRFAYARPGQPVKSIG